MKFLILLIQPVQQTIYNFFSFDLAEFGQRGYIGKVSMDQNSPDYYIETTKQAIEDAERCFNLDEKRVL